MRYHQPRSLTTVLILACTIVTGCRTKLRPADATYVYWIGFKINMLALVRDLNEKPKLSFAKLYRDSSVRLQSLDSRNVDKDLVNAVLQLGIVHAEAADWADRNPQAAVAVFLAAIAQANPLSVVQSEFGELNDIDARNRAAIRQINALAPKLTAEYGKHLTPLPDFSDVLSAMKKE